jgi:hypothetical protein
MPGLGWDPAKAVAVERDLLLSGRYCTVGAPEKPSPTAVSLAKHRLASYEQGKAGTCWVHSPKQMAEIIARALGYEAIPVCRRLMGWAGVELMGGGNPDDGGSPTAAIRTMTAWGVGIADERLWPYTDDRNQLDDQPPQAVIADAKQRHLVAPVVVKSIDEGKRLIAGGRPVANGIPWPANWQEGRQTFMTTIGQIIGGHSITWIGYVNAGVWDQYEWMQFENSHGTIYSPLSAARAAKVSGYRPTTQRLTADFWARRDVYTKLCAGQVTEHVSATDMEGLKKGIVLPGPSFDQVIV